MPQEARQYELVLLGATGYTGKLTAEWISTNLPEDLKWAIAGRNAKKLQVVIDELTKLNPNRKQPAIETAELKKDQLDNLSKKTKLLITTIGPYMHYGEPVLAACAEHGTHYLDCTGEVPWYHDMVSKYHSTAQKSGAIIIPQCGLDSVPADIMAFSLTNYIRKTLHAPTKSVTMTMYDFKSGISGGTTATMLELFENYSLAKLATTMKPFSLSPVRPTSPSRPPTSGLPYRLLGLHNVPELGGLQTVWLMAGVDACLAHRSWGLYETFAKEHSRPDLSYGPNFRFTEYLRAKSLVAGVFVSYGLGLLSVLLAFPLSRWVLSPLIKKFFIPAPGEGPSKEAMKKDFLHYRAFGTADTEKQEKITGSLYCGHGGYAATGLTLSAAADVILRGRLEETEAGRIGGGILTPATLGEQFVEKLRVFGMKVEVGV